MVNELNRGSRLRPYQREFVHDFLEGRLGERVLLVHHVGMGASYTAIETVKEHVLSQPHARVLVLVASGMLEQWHFQLMEAGVGHDLVDRYRYRELQDSLFGQSSLWANSKVVLMRPRFDQSMDMLSSLDLGRWTMIVAVDSHRLMREGSELLVKITENSPHAKVLLLSPFHHIDGPYTELQSLNIVRLGRFHAVALRDSF